MAAITWQNIDAPKVNYTPLALANQSYGDAIDGLQGLLKRHEDTNRANWDQGKINNTNAFNTELLSATTPEELAAKRAQLTQMITGAGAQIDSKAALSALDARLPQLQQRFTADAAYQDAVQAPQRDAVLAAARGGDELTRNILMNDPALRNKAELLRQSDAIKQEKVMQERGTTEFDWRGQKFKDDLKTSAAQRNASYAAAQASIAAKNMAGTHAVTAQINAEKDLVEASTKAKELAQKNKYGVPVDFTANSPLRAQYDTIFNAKGQGSTILNDIAKQKFTIPTYDDTGKLLGRKAVDVPQAILDKAVSIVSNRWFEGITPQYRSAGAVASTVQDLLNDENEVRNITQAQKELGRASDTSTTGGQAPSVATATAVPTPAEASKAIRNGAFAATPPPESSSWDPFNVNDKRPKLSSSGDMVFSNNGFDFTSERGVAAPKGIPMGARTVKALDGDTLQITGEDGKSMKIRLGTGDAGETAHGNSQAQASGKAGMEYLVNSLMNSGRTQLVFSDSQPDKYGRHIAKLFVNGKDFTKAAISDGVMVPLDLNNSIGDQAANAALLKDAIRNNKGMFNNRDPKDILTPALARATGQSRH